MSSAAWCELYKPVIIRVLHEALNDNHSVGTHFNQNTKQKMEIIWRNTPSRLLQDGLDVRHETVSLTHVEEENDHSVVVTENGIRYLCEGSNIFHFLCNPRRLSWL